MKFVDGVHIGCSPQIDVLGQSCCYHFLSCCTHDLLQTCIYDVFFLGSLQEQRSVKFLNGDVCCLLNNTQQVVLGLFLPFSLHAARSHMVKILQPFEVAYSNSTSIAQNIRQELNTSFGQDLFTL